MVIASKSWEELFPFVGMWKGRMEKERVQSHSLQLVTVAPSGTHGPQNQNPSVSQPVYTRHLSFRHSFGLVPDGTICMETKKKTTGSAVSLDWVVGIQNRNR